MNLSQAIASAKRSVLEKRDRHAYVCQGENGGFEVWSFANYQETGDEHDCKAVVWSYADGRYDDQNEFHENGRLAAAVERY